MYLDFTPDAIVAKFELLSFVSNLHSTEIALEVEAAIDMAVEQLLIVPHQWPIVTTKRGDVFHRIVVNRHSIILYKVEGEKIQIVDFLDARSDRK